MEQKRIKAVDTVGAMKNEMVSQIQKVAQMPTHLGNFSKILNEEASATLEGKQISVNFIQKKYGYTGKDKDKALDMLKHMASAMKIMEKDLPEAVIVRGNKNKIDYLRTLDRFMDMPANDFLMLYIKYRDSEKIPANLWNAVASIVDVAKKYGYTGEDKEEAFKYIEQVLKGLTSLIEKNELPSEYIVRKEGNEVDYLQTLDKFKEMPLNDFMNLKFFPAKLWPTLCS